MHICYIIWKFSSPINFQHMGGAENQLLKITNNLKNRENVEITILSKKNPDDLDFELISKNIKIKRIRTTNIPILSMIIFNISLIFALIKINDNKKIDIIHLPLPDIYLIAIFLIRYIIKIPIISRIAADELYPFRSKNLWLINRLVIRYLIFKSDGIQTLNKLTYLYALYLKFNKEKLFLIPNGIEISKNIKDYKKITKKIFYIGAMRYSPRKFTIEQKNLKFLLDAFKIVVSKMPDLKLIMVGDGNYRVVLENISKEYQLEKNVIFTGYQTNINKFLEFADIFVNPSHYEGMPNTVIEAMSKGVLVLCSKIHEHEFIINDYVNGILFDQKNEDDLANKILAFYKNPTTFFEIARKGREHIIKNQSIDNITNKNLEMYKSIIKLYQQKKLNLIK